MTARTAIDARPCDGLPVPPDATHQFLEARLRADDRDLAAWEQHFQETGVRYERVERARGTVMLYTHRVLDDGRWCCASASGEAATSEGALSSQGPGAGVERRALPGRPPRVVGPGRDSLGARAGDPRA